MSASALSVDTASASGLGSLGLARAKAMAARAAATDSDKALKQQASAFVGWFMGEFLKTMRSTIKTESLGHGGSAEDTFQGFYDDRLAEQVVDGGASYGLTELIYKSLQRKCAVSAAQETA